MNENKKRFVASALSLIFAMSFLTTNVFAASSGSAMGEPPGDPPGGSAMGQPPGDPPDGAPGGMGGDSASVSYTAANTIESSSEISDNSYKSTAGGENALLVSGGESTIKNVTVTKSGDESSESSDFYGTNAAVLVYNGATLNIEGGSVTTDGAHANGVFACGTGTININGTAINTSANNSGGIMVTGGGTLNADNLTVETQGNSSAAIRSDRGGGTMTVTGGSYTTNGQGSSTVYSTADITVNNAKLTSTSSEGVVVEGANSVTLNGTVLTDTNTSLNGQSETYKNVFLYQSMSGDAAEGTSQFTANDSTIITNKGDTFYITNTTSVINLTNNAIVNNDPNGVLLRAESAAWGKSGSNGGKVTLNMTNQTAEGDIVIDSISSLSMELAEGSVYKGTINGANQGGNVSLALDADSMVVLTGDSYVDSLSNADTGNTNIYLNGYSLYVGGTALSANDGEAPEVVTAVKTTGSVNSSSSEFPAAFAAVGIIILLAAAGCTAFVVVKTKDKNNRNHNHK